MLDAAHVDGDPARHGAIRPRVLLVSAVPNFKGGAEVVIKNMMTSALIEVVLAVPEEGAVADMAHRAGVPVCFYRPTALLGVHRPPRLKHIVAAVVDAFRCAKRLRDFVRIHRCDVVHTNGLKPHALSAILALIWRVPTVVHMHDIPYSRAERLIWRLIQLCVMRMIIVSRPCYPGARLPSNVFVIPNGIVPTHTSLPANGAFSSPLRLGFVGRFHPHKGMDLMLDWVKEIQREGVDFTLTLRGRPDPDLPAYWEHIQTRIRDEGLGQVVTHEGWLDRAKLYDDLDMLMVPSHRPDPGPLVVTEAMSAGVIVVGYPAGGIPTAIEDGVNGLLVRNADEFGRRVLDFLAKPAAIQAMRQKAHDDVIRIYGMDAFHGAVNEIYQGMRR